MVSSACPPYETEYIGSKFTFQRSNALADVAGFYRAFGLELSRSHPERHDHIAALELEFMAYLIGLERTGSRKAVSTLARAPGNLSQRTTSISYRASVLVDAGIAHLLTRQNPDGFYEAAGAFLAALIPAERGISVRG